MTHNLSITLDKIIQLYFCYNKNTKLHPDTLFGGFLGFFTERKSNHAPCALIKIL